MNILIDEKQRLPWTHDQSKTLYLVLEALLNQFETENRATLDAATNISSPLASFFITTTLNGLAKHARHEDQCESQRWSPTSSTDPESSNCNCGLRAAWLKYQHLLKHLTGSNSPTPKPLKS